MKNKHVIGATALAIVTTLMTAVPALAQANDAGKAPTNTGTGMQRPAGERGQGLGGMMRLGIIGTVSTISGNTITVLGHAGFGKTAVATTTYTVDATNAKVTKGNATSTVANIAIGDNVAVQGTITGTNVVATMIRDGIMAGRPGLGLGRGENGQGNGKMGSTTPAFTGNGEPIIAGKISAISGSSVSITNSSNVTYTVDATNAKITQGNTVSDISTLKTGDTVLVQGTVNGTSIVATTVIDQNRLATSQNPDKKPGFFGGIGQFFMHLFGF